MSRWAECSKEINEKMRRDNFSKEHFVNKYNVDVIDIEAMLSGEVPYNEKMNSIASDFLGRKIDCSPNLNDCKLAFRKNQDCDSDNLALENKLKELFNNCIKEDNNIKKIDTSVIKDISSFKEYFNVSRPITIDGFINQNRDKDNFVLIRSSQIKGIAGASMRLKDIAFIYINTSNPLGRQIFTFFHELYHIYFELTESNIKVTKDEDISYSCETEADKFSSEILIDRSKILSELLEKNRSIIESFQFDEICDLQAEYNCTFQCIIYCIQHLFEWIKENNLDHRLVKYIPQIPASLLMYYNKKYWDELENRIESYNCNIKLNTATNEEEILKSYIG